MARTYIASPITFYVNNIAGLDTNDGLTTGTAWQTIQHAVNMLQDAYDFAAQPTIQLATTGVNYAENVVLARYVGSLGWRGAGNYTYPTIQGDPTNNGAVVMHPTTGAPFTSVNGAPWIIANLMVCSWNSFGIVSDAGAHLLANNVNFGLCGAGHMCAEFGGFIETIIGGYTISNSAQYHVVAAQKGIFVAQGNLVTLANIPTFIYFAQANCGSYVQAGGLSFTGSCQSGHPGQVSNDGTALMYPTSNGTWP